MLIRRCRLLLSLLLGVSAAQEDRCRLGSLALSFVAPEACAGNTFLATEVAQSLLGCCTTCVNTSICTAFAFRDSDGLCALSNSSACITTAMDSASAWMSAALPSASDATSACTGDAVVATSTTDLVSSLGVQITSLGIKAANFWLLHGPDSALPGSFHTGLDQTGLPTPDAAKSARRTAEDLGALSAHAASCRAHGDKAGGYRAQVAADAMLAFMYKAFKAPSRGSPLQERMNASSVDIPFSTHAAVISALSIYARHAPNLTAAKHAVVMAEAQLSAMLKCCHDSRYGGFIPRWEIAQGWYPSGAQKTLGTHAAALGAVSALHNVSASPTSASLLSELVNATQRTVVGEVQPFVGAFFTEDWQPLASTTGAYTNSAPAEFGAALALLASIAGAGSRAPPPPLLLQAAGRAGERGYDVHLGGYFESTAGGPKIAWQQASAAQGLLWLWRLTHQREVLCRAVGTLDWLLTHQLAAAGAPYWSVNKDGVPVGPHGSLLAEAWQGAGLLGSLAAMRELLDEIQPAEMEAEQLLTGTEVMVSASVNASSPTFGIGSCTPSNGSA